MNSRIVRSLCAQRQCVAFVVVILSFVTASAVTAGTISFELTCSLNVLSSSGSCSPGPSFGTVTLEDLSGVDAGKVEVTVDLGFPSSQKFKDLILNYTGAATTISDSDSGNTVVLNSNNYSISPYDGDFDVGGTGGQGWHAMTSGPYSTILSGNAPLSAADFTTLDSLGNLYAALHIQDIGSSNGGNCSGTGSPACVPGMNGPGSLKIGAPHFTAIPEPSAVCICAGVLALLCVWNRKR
jgi:hypothetical protein